MSTNDVLTLAIENHHNISATNVFINCTNSQGTDLMRISVSNDCLRVSLYKEAELLHCLKLKTPVNFFIPTSFHCLNIRNASLRTDNRNDTNIVEADFKSKPENGFVDKQSGIDATFRIQTNGSKIDNSVSESLSKLTVSKKEELFNLSIDVPYMVYCAGCLEKLADVPITFKKVFTLPPNLSELSENWFCHKHGDQATCITHKKNELFTSPTCYYLNCLNFNYLYTEENNSLIHCKRCLSILSQTKPTKGNGAIGYFKDKLKFTLSESPCSDIGVLPHGITMELNILQTLIQETFEASVICKLYLESKHNETEDRCLLLWVLDRNISRCLIVQDVEDTNSEKVLESDACMKVLYCVTNPTTKLARSWRHDFAVDCHDISDSMMTNIITVLCESSLTVPSKHKLVDDYVVGFLPVNKL